MEGRANQTARHLDSSTPSSFRNSNRFFRRKVDEIAFDLRADHVTAFAGEMVLHITATFRTCELVFGLGSSDSRTLQREKSSACRSAEKTGSPRAFSSGVIDSVNAGFPVFKCGSSFFQNCFFNERLFVAAFGVPWRTLSQALFHGFKIGENPARL